jgi:hypothetical protein
MDERRHMDRESALRREIYHRTLQTGLPPTIAELADASGRQPADVREGLHDLAASRIVVLQPGTGELLMAAPFSAVPTPFLVTTARHSSYANCAWDALGIPVMMRTRARVHTACACCGDAIVLDVDPDRPPVGVEIVHFAVPAVRWWQDIVFT